MVAPDAVSVTLLPLQIVDEGLVLMVTVGVGLTEISLVPEFVHPLPFVPKTVYVVVAETTFVILDVVCPPGNQLYTDAPVAESVTVAPLQIVADGLTLIDTVGEETVIKRVDVTVQPNAFVPTTV